MGATASTRAAVTTTLAQTQRYRGLGDDAEDNLATLFTAGAVEIWRCGSLQKPLLSSDSPQVQALRFSGVLESESFRRSQRDQAQYP